MLTYSCPGVTSAANAFNASRTIPPYAAMLMLVSNANAIEWIGCTTSTL